MPTIICTLQSGAVVLPTGSYDGALPLVLSDVVCIGNESTLLDCSPTLAVECISGEGAAIVCQGKSYWHVF